ncbi:MAG: MarR family transcriptional regulator [Alphaproteobacteria bacterium]|jgi:DNA-binding MarR family transcriptional regulator|nr:MarR family transcriptional regulator [Alphaproteobacteria bacterium]
MIMQETSSILSKRIRRTTRNADLDQGVLPGLLGYNLRKAQLAVFQSFQNAIAPYDVSPGQFGILVLISENPGLSQSELGNAMGIDRSTMVAVIDRLETRKFVMRQGSPYDRRSYALQLTPEGQELVSKLVPLVKQHEDSIASELSKTELNQLIDMLARIALNVR